MKNIISFAENESRSSVVTTWTGSAVGGVHALDVDDYNPEEQYMKVRHRPDTGTPIKNQGDGERLVAFSDDICELLDDWITTKRPDVTDEHGREPLLASRQGRLQKTTLRMYVYRWTLHCAHGEECPHECDPDTCEGNVRDAASKCPSSVSPHAIRRGSITHGLNNDMPDKVVSDRANVSPQVIEQHYDRRTEQEKMEQRRDTWIIYKISRGSSQEIRLQSIVLYFNPDRWHDGIYRW